MALKSMRFMSRSWPVRCGLIGIAQSQIALYHGGGTAGKASNTLVVDLRSDTVTLPNKAMRDAMHSADVGDDVYGEDPSINNLQEKVAKLFNKEAALFVPTGTMGNLISCMIHCNQRGLECILGDKSHIFLYEQGGIAQIAGVQPHAIPNNPDGTFSIHALKSSIRPLNDVHQPLTRLVCMENTHNFCGGKVLPLSFMKEVYESSKAADLVVHMDGARLMNSAVAMDLPPSEILQYCDSVNMCFSKGLGAPVGSVIAGKSEFIESAVRVRKVLGGGMRQAGILAAASSVALDQAQTTLTADHRHAKMLAAELSSIDNGVVKVNLDGIHTNIVMIDVTKHTLTAAQLSTRLMQVTEQEKLDLKDSIVVKTLAFGYKLLRYVTNYNVTEEDIHHAARKFKYVLQEYS
ncbi:uncharacterized protein LOC135493114 [Lineus longissimus]|uniref:uncharacterized protein LOC135493114 n=1 Tax=Lineus longissimus TaxID=88925 RepID=UPI002B4F15DB